MSGPADVPIGNTYDKYATQNPIERRLMKGFYTALDGALPTTAPRSILEVGVGEAMIAERVRNRFPTARYVGIDLLDDELGGSWRDRALAGCFADITRLPFPDRSFDLVLGIEVLEHVPEPAAAIAEIDRVATNDIVLSVPREPIWRLANLLRGKYIRTLGNTPGHIQHWTKRGFGDLVGDRFALRSVATPFPWTMVGARVRGQAGVS